MFVYIIQMAERLGGGGGGQMAERLGSQAIDQKVVGSIPGRAEVRVVLGQGTSPSLPRGNVPCLPGGRPG